MRTYTFTLVGKRPDYATDELALKRHDVEGLSYRQIAQEWNISPGMVERMVHRARKKALEFTVTV